MENWGLICCKDTPEGTPDGVEEENDLEKNEEKTKEADKEEQEELENLIRELHETSPGKRVQILESIRKDNSMIKFD